MKKYIPAQTQELSFKYELMVTFGFSVPGPRIEGDYIYGGDNGGNASDGF